MAIREYWIITHNVISIFSINYMLYNPLLSLIHHHNTVSMLFFFSLLSFFFFLKQTPSTESYTLSLHDALPISISWQRTFCRLLYCHGPYSRSCQLLVVR